MPCTLPPGSISRWNPVLQYNCLLRRIPFKCVRSAEVLRDSLSAGAKWSFNSPRFSPRGGRKNCDPTCPKPSRLCKNVPISPIAAITNRQSSTARAVRETWSGCIWWSNRPKLYVMTNNIHASTSCGSMLSAYEISLDSCRLGIQTYPVGKKLGQVL